MPRVSGLEEMSYLQGQAEPDPGHTLSPDPGHRLSPDLSGHPSGTGFSRRKAQKVVVGTPLLNPVGEAEPTL